MDLIKIDKGYNNYPFLLNQYFNEHASCTVNAIGNLDLLQDKPLAVFSSSKCPGNIILRTYDFIRQLRNRKVTVISGFHSSIERECLNILLKGNQPVIICPARGIEGMRLKPEYKKPLEDGRFLFISSFTEKEKRISAERALERNRFIAAIADKIFIPYAAPKSKTENLCSELIKKGKTILTFDSEHNRNLLESGAAVIDIELGPA
ncbi:MAG: DNA-processing protein DprA [Nitrospirae bacterium]|nr:DNA-processing protein DprA [Nitrospirota bacterium]